MIPNVATQERILASPVCQDDVMVRLGKRPFLPKFPFVPGYAILGEVDAVAAGVTAVAPGDRVVALTNFDGHAEYIYWPAQKLAPAPTSLDPTAAVVLLLNYLVAYQILHRVAQVKRGDTVLVIGASGGVGTAFLQLGKLAGLQMYGLASAAKHATLTQYGAIPIDYRTQDMVQVLRKAEPAGFWLGLWHGLIVPFTFIASLFKEDVGVYEVHNNGNWYNFGFILGLMIVFGGNKGGGVSHKESEQA